MRIGFTQFGDPEKVLGVLKLPEPHPGPGQVRIRTVAADIKVSETMLCMGYLVGQVDAAVPSETAPVVAGWDLSGVIDEVGPGAQKCFAPGDSVIAVVDSYSGRGAHAEYVVADVASVVLAPKGKSFVEAASFLTNALTARVWLDALGLVAGETVAITGGAGTVGGFVIELAKERGLHVVVDAKESDRAFLEQLAADVIVDRTDDFAGEVIEAVGPVHGLIDAANVADCALLRAVQAGRTAVSARMQTGHTDHGVHWTPVFVENFHAETICWNKCATSPRQCAHIARSRHRSARTGVERLPAAHARRSAGTIGSCLLTDRATGRLCRESRSVDTGSVQPRLS
ncbi:quinone oxidoreductase [Rhodococcus sp. B7740]|uniref:NADP-dependent oxidoreductase n=1 Tax=Rhodococcus sp. B7740 TaxID=1564114 RepID=UPI0005DA61E8|nr:NADP-dependent oxidoreductase [Rhodococcus sp. B7740]AJW40243.1 quinone oxidoreductase [Rhodococcus sp. B7740]